jgi:hypothetical protein
VADPTDPPPQDPPDPVDPPQDPPDPPDDDPTDPPDPPKDPELAKAIKRRDAALAAKKRADDELAALKAKYEPDKADPVKAANRRLVTAEARTVLTAAGITEREDQKEVLGFLDLDSVSVTDDGDVDADAIQDRVEALRRIFGGKAPAGKRTPRVDTRDKGGDNGKPLDAASKRRREMLGYR